MPLSFIDVLICINHSSITLGVPTNPESIIPISICAEKSPPSMSFIFNPISSILSLQLPPNALPISTLPMSLIILPHPLVLIPILVELNSKLLLLVIFPVSNVPCRSSPFLSLNSAIFILLLSFHPVD